MSWRLAVRRRARASRIGRHLETLAGGEDALLFVTPGGNPLRYNQWRKAYFDRAVAGCRAHRRHAA
ncbi:hypothetical protein OG379_39205 [Streptomyces sp. NBC_01166]|nr:hypothetical protein OG379_39205 [Streptomyces sp. NBC_01166]